MLSASTSALLLTAYREGTHKAGTERLSLVAWSTGGIGEAEDGAGGLRPRLAPWPAAKALLESLRPYDHHHVRATNVVSAPARGLACHFTHILYISSLLRTGTSTVIM